MVITHRKPFAFTLIELLVVIAIIALLVSILMPALSRAKELARRTGCLSNLHHLALATQMYIGDFNEFPFSWEMGVEHTETMSHGRLEVYSNNLHPHFWDEGHSFTPYWTEYFIVYRYAATSASAYGCSFSAPDGWNVFPYNGGRASLTLRDTAEIRKYPTYIYRGPSSVEDHRLTDYTGGQIAGAGASDTDFHSGGEARSGTYYPIMAKIGRRKAKPLFTCPVFVNGTIDGYENYAAPHAFPRGVRNRATAPMNGGPRGGHYLAESVGWSDGRATVHEQPTPGGRWYVNYDGEVTTSFASKF